MNWIKNTEPGKSEPYRMSQSTFKEFRKYRRGFACGEFVRRVIVGKEFISETEYDSPQYWGNVFEWYALGSGEKPERELYKVNQYGKDNPLAGTGYLKGDPKPNPKFEHAKKQGDAFKDFCDTYEITVRAKDVTIPKGDLIGKIDAIVQIPPEHWDELVNHYHADSELHSEPDNIRQLSKEMVTDRVRWEDCKYGEHSGCVVIDTKYSGIIYKKHHKMSFHPDYIEENDYHTVQARHYHALTGLPFFFYVASPSDMTVLFLRIFIEQSNMEKHIETCGKYLKMIKAGIYTPRPDSKRCGDCPLSGDCEHEDHTPKVRAAWI
jgi:hypothetical protein